MSAPEIVFQTPSSMLAQQQAHTVESTPGLQRQFIDAMAGMMAGLQGAGSGWTRGDSIKGNAPRTNGGPGSDHHPSPIEAGRGDVKPSPARGRAHGEDRRPSREDRWMMMWVATSKTGLGLRDERHEVR